MRAVAPSHVVPGEGNDHDDAGTISSPAADRLLRLIGVDDRFTYTRGLDDVLRGEPAGEGNAVTGRA